MNPVETIVATRSTVKAARRLAVSAPTFYASNQGAARPAAPLTRARIRAGSTTTRTVHASEIALHD